MNFNLDLFYKYSVYFFQAMIIVVVIVLIALLVKALGLMKKAKTMEPVVNNINRNFELTNKKINAVSSKVKKDAKTVSSVVKYGLLAKIIFDDFNEAEEKNVSSFVKSTGRGLRKQNEQQFMRQLRRNYNNKGNN